MIYVIGSGPSGIAAASALLGKGHSVTLLDYGLELEKKKQDILATLKTLPSAEWPPELVSQLKEGVQSSRKGVRKKKSYGSDFVFRDVAFIENKSDRVDAKPSLAKGGFSNTWGSVVLPFLDQDMDDWPLKQKDFVAHYEAVLSLTGLVASRDGLEKHFPLYAEKFQSIQMSRQAEKMIARMDEHRDRLEKEGVFYGRPRLALRTESSAEGPGCVYCGLCLYGCPYQLIYNSTFTLKKLQENPKFHYRPGVYIENIKEQASSATIVAKDKSTGEKLTFEAERVFLGGGVLSSTRIVLASLGAVNTEVVIKDSQYFIVPLLFRQGTRGVEKEALYTLSQLLMEIMDPSISPYAMNLQLYTYNDLYRNVLTQMFGPLSFLLKPILSPLLGRLAIFQGYLHSKDSSEITARLEMRGEESVLQLSSRENARAKGVLSKLGRKLSGLSTELNGWALTPFISQAIPGEGNHYGGSFPMSHNPGPLQTDLLGRPKGFERLHVVDASVFPSIPATSITLSIMANAHRIASQAPTPR